MKTVLVALALLLFTIVRTQPDGPAISTENGNLQISSQGSITFWAGEGGQIQFMSADNEEMMVGEKGQKGEMGARGDMGMVGAAGTDGVDGRPGLTGPPGSTGPQGAQGAQGVKGMKGEIGMTGAMGQQGLRGVAASDSALVTWNECVFNNLNSGLDYGLIATCHLNKARNDTWVRITWSGNMRITRCQTCCMRWYFTINGEECVDPGPIDMVKFQGQNYHLLRHSTVIGTCTATGTADNSYKILAGPLSVQFLIMDCPGFNGAVYDAFTGWNSVSRITVEEIIPRDTTFPEVSVVTPPDEFTYSPRYCQYFYPHLGGNRERNVGTLAVVKFFKQHPFTILRVTWVGNLLKRGCNNCCAQWRIEIDGDQCSEYEDITTSIASTTAQSIFAPSTITGFCSRAGILPILNGNHQIRLVVQGCTATFLNTAAGFFSSSRLIVEEIPLPRDPQVNPAFYHPQWAHCTPPATAFGGQDEGPFPEGSCSFNKTTDDSSVRVTYDGNLRLFSCMECCMRWFVTLNGAECVSPAPIEAVVAASDVTAFSIHRSSTITGICDATETGALLAGEVTAILNVGPCEGFNETFDAFTGFQTASTFTLEELPAPLDPAPTDRYTPIWTHCVSDFPLEDTRNVTDNSTTDEPIQTCAFTKQQDDTALRIAWDGNIALNDCADCCMRWFLTLDGEECSDPGPVDIALSQSLTDTYDLNRPASIVGVCNAHGNSTTTPAGDYKVELRVAPCEVTDEGNQAAVPDPGTTTTGYNSVSRFVVEEIPKSGEECV